MMKKFPLFYFADLKKSPTFAVHKELGSHICWPKGEKGIRCESGTIPVAVYLNSVIRVQFIAIFATGNYWEGAINGMSQKTYLGAFGKIIPAGYGCESKLFFIITFQD